MTRFLLYRVCSSSQTNLEKEGGGAGVGRGRIMSAVLHYDLSNTGPFYLASEAESEA